MSLRAEQSGSRYLYAPFDTAHVRIDAAERLAEERWTALERRLARMEAVLDRLEKRLWMAVFGIVAVVLAEGVASLIATQP